MRAKGLECTQLVLNLELLSIDKAIAFSSYLTIIPQFITESSIFSRLMMVRYATSYEIDDGALCFAVTHPTSITHLFYS
jgi:hypothetical protein